MESDVFKFIKNWLLKHTKRKSSYIPKYLSGKNSDD